MMNKWLISLAALCFCAVLAAQTPEPAAPAVTVSGKVNADFLNMRTGAGLNFPVAGKIPLDTEVKIIREIGNWLEIAAPATMKIYVSEARVNADGVLVGELNMRSAMSTSATIIGVLPKGAKVQRLDERRNGWVRIVPPETLKLYVAAFCVNYDKAAFETTGLPKSAVPAAETEKAPAAETESGKTAEAKTKNLQVELTGIVTAWKYSDSPETAYALLDAPDGKNLAFLTAEKAETIAGFAGKPVTVSGEIVKTTPAGAKIVCVRQIAEITVE